MQKVSTTAQQYQQAVKVRTAILSVGEFFMSYRELPKEGLVPLPKQLRSQTQVMCALTLRQHGHKPGFAACERRVSTPRPLSVQYLASLGTQLRSLGCRTGSTRLTPCQDVLPKCSSSPALNNSPKPWAKGGRPESQGPGGIHSRRGPGNLTFLLGTSSRRTTSWKRRSYGPSST